MQENDLCGMFPVGELAPSEVSRFFSGRVWLHALVPDETEYNCGIANVTFEPGCRNNWHVHPGGQILVQ